MKNLPEDELFNSIENRLRDYSELPDEETWNRISDVVAPGAEPAWIIWTNRTAATLSLAILFLLFNSHNSPEDVAKRLQSNTFSGKKQPGAITQSSVPDGLQSVKLNTETKQSTQTPLINSLESSHKNSQSLPETQNENFQSINKSEAQKEEVIENAPIANDSEQHLIGEAPRVDSALVEKKAVRKDSASSEGIVLPPNKRHKKSKFSFYSMVSPSLSFQHVTPDSDDGVVVEKINSPGVISHERFGFAVETGIQGQLSERFQYIFGLSYYQQSQQLEYEETSEGVIVESGDNLNYDIKPSTTTRTLDYSMRNVGIQAGLLYTLKLGGLMHKAGVALQYQMGLQQATEGAEYDNSSSHYLNYQLLYRVEYQFRSGIGLFVQPSYIHSIISNETLDAPYKLKQSRAVLGVGIVYRF